MSLTTFITQKQIMARNGPADPQQQMIQRVLLYASPLFLAVFGFNFPIAVLLYWLTTNAWSMGQQHFIIKRMPPLADRQERRHRPPAAASSGGGLTSLLKGKPRRPPAPAAPTRLTQVRQTRRRSAMPPSRSDRERAETDVARVGRERAAATPGGGRRNVKPANGLVAAGQPARRSRRSAVARAVPTRWPSLTTSSAAAPCVARPMPSVRSLCPRRTPVESGCLFARSAH